jgi:hypothetical protein
MKQSEVEGYIDAVSLNCISFHRGYVSLSDLLGIYKVIYTFCKHIEQGHIY